MQSSVGHMIVWRKVSENKLVGHKHAPAHKQIKYHCVPLQTLPRHPPRDHFTLWVGADEILQPRGSGLDGSAPNR